MVAVRTRSIWKASLARSWYWSKIFGKSPLASIISMVFGAFTAGRGPAVARMVSDCSNSRRPFRWLSSFIRCLPARRPCRRVTSALTQSRMLLSRFSCSVTIACASGLEVVGADSSMIRE